MLNTNRWAGDGIGLPPSIIKSIQRFYGSSLDFPLTISEVDPDYAIIILTSHPKMDASTAVKFVGFSFVDSTHITADYADETSGRYIGLMVIEFDPAYVKFKQTGLVTATQGVIPANAALTQNVNPAKCLCFVYGYFEDSSVRLYFDIALSSVSASEIVFTGYSYSGSPSGAPYARYQLIELR